MGVHSLADCLSFLVRVAKFGRTFSRFDVKLLKIPQNNTLVSDDEKTLYKG